MKKNLLAILACVLILSLPILVNGEITGNVSVNEDLFVMFEFKGLDQSVYEQARTQFTAERIPEVIVGNLEKKNQIAVARALPLESDDSSRTILSSFYLGGSAIVSFTINKTTLKRVYEVRMDWRKFEINLTDGYSIDFAQYVATPVADWQKTDATTFYYENRSPELDVLFYLTLPASASAIRAQGDTVFYELPPYAEDVFLGTPFLILIALAVTLVIILLYRKAH